MAVKLLGDGSLGDAMILGSAASDRILIAIQAYIAVTSITAIILPSPCSGWFASMPRVSSMNCELIAARSKINLPKVLSNVSKV